MNSYYEILGLKQGIQASAADIRKQYLKLIKLNHPDKTATNSHNKFLLIQRAYDTLINPATKSAYDIKYKQMPHHDEIDIEEY